MAFTEVVMSVEPEMTWLSFVDLQFNHVEEKFAVLLHGYYIGGIQSPSQLGFNFPYLKDQTIFLAPKTGGSLVSLFVESSADVQLTSLV